MHHGLLRDRFRGALLGAAVGDGLGAPFEGGPPAPMEALDALLKQPGLLRYTDDTHMTLGTAESLLACGGFDGAHMAETYARNFEAEPWRGYGAGPPQVFRMLRQGVAWDQVGEALFGGAGSFGNGAAMRVAPVGLAYAYHLEQAARAASESARITHAHALGMEGAVLQAVAVALLVRGDSSEPLDPAAFTASLSGWIESPVLAERLERVSSMMLTASVEEVTRTLGNGIAAHEAVPAALYSLLRHPDSFSQAVVYAISLGGDTDTIASMTGALAGARLGAGAVPPQWRDGVEGAERLSGLADALLDLAVRNAPGG